MNEFKVRCGSCSSDSQISMSYWFNHASWSSLFSQSPVEKTAPKSEKYNKQSESLSKRDSWWACFHLCSVSQREKYTLRHLTPWGPTSFHEQSKKYREKSSLSILHSLSGIPSKISTKGEKTTGTLNRPCSIFAHVNLFSIAYTLTP